MDKNEIIEYINTLERYQGYVQFSHRPIVKSKDIFLDGKIKVENEDGFIYEAHFANEKESISIRQINDSWLVSETDISNIDENDIQEFLADIKGLPNIKMAQIWETGKDEFCKDLNVSKLKKVVFAGFKGEK